MTLPTDPSEAQHLAAVITGEAETMAELEAQDAPIPEHLGGVARGVADLAEAELRLRDRWSDHLSEPFGIERGYEETLASIWHHARNAAAGSLGSCQALAALLALRAGEASQYIFSKHRELVEADKAKQIIKNRNNPKGPREGSKIDKIKQGILRRTRLGEEPRDIAARVAKDCGVTASYVRRIRKEIVSEQ